MQSERWEKIQALFHEALARPETERIAWVRRECGGDDAVYDEVVSLLNAIDAAPLSRAVGEAAKAVEADLGRTVIGARIGAYRIERELGRGGMGRVYLARRDDEAYDRQVAVKLLAAGRLSESARHQLATERRMLARLHHANIATLIDGGTSEDGTPYVVMEYVDGQSIDRHVLEQASSVETRLRLVSKVCEAATHAHRNLVIHRDIKPSNVLVTRDGVPKLLDFGIAKLLDADRGPSTVTMAGIMTPAYASPEQVEGLPVTTATDIYSLGALLYHVLTDQPPFELTTSSPIEAARQICHTQPPAPSSVAGVSSKRARRLRGDLDNIVLRAMHKSPERRYPSAQALASDIEAYLDGRPVSARPDTWTYRAAKFLRRNALTSGLVAAFVVALAATAVFYTAQLQSERDRALAAEAAANRAAEAAQREAETAEQVTEFMIGLFRIADPREGARPDAKARELLDEGASEIETALADQPAVQSRLLLAMGLAFNNLGAFEAGTDLVEKSVAKTRANPDASAMDIAESLNRLGEALRFAGNRARAAEVHAEALAIKERESTEPNWALADSYNNYGLLLYQLGRYGESAAMLNRAIETHRAAADSQQKSEGISMHNLALVHRQLAEFERADALITSALQKIDAEIGDQSAPYAVSLQLAGRVRSDMGDYAGARRLLDASLAIADRIYESDNPRLGALWERYGTLHCALGEFEEAEERFRQGLAVYAATYGVDSWETAFVQHRYGRCLTLSGRPEEALPLLRRSVQLREQQFGPDHILVGIAQSTLALAQAQIEAHEGAVHTGRSAIAKMGRTFAEDHPDRLVAELAISLATGNDLTETLIKLRARGEPTHLLRYAEGL